MCPTGLCRQRRGTFVNEGKAASVCKTAWNASLDLTVQCYEQHASIPRTLLVVTLAHTEGFCAGLQRKLANRG